MVSSFSAGTRLATFLFQLGDYHNVLRVKLSVGWCRILASVAIYDRMKSNADAARPRRCSYLLRTFNEIVDALLKMGLEWAFHSRSPTFVSGGSFRGACRIRGHGLNRQCTSIRTSVAAARYCSGTSKQDCRLRKSGEPAPGSEK
jgi:hypothetical protein